MVLNQDTIVAVTTARGHGGVGIVRISGNKALEIAKNILKKDNLIPRIALHTDFFNTDAEVLDNGIALYFKGPHSFTGEDVLELHAHGNPVILNMLVNQCLFLGARLAEAGEFSKRAYLNGKIDLIQAESIIDLINAESESAAKSALRSLKGAFSKYIEEIKEQLINLRMFIEAAIDFPEEDLELIAQAKIKEKLELIHHDFHRLLKSAQDGVILNNGANIVIIGRPNVGKSSLLNVLASEDVAIVSDIEGTTRDVIKEKIIIDGIAFNIIDTAGIRKTENPIEEIGIERTQNAIKSADLCLILIDETIGITEEDSQIIKKLPKDMPRIFVHNKIDLVKLTAKVERSQKQLNVYISAKSGLGIEELRNEILSMVHFDNRNHDVFTARTRHVNALKLSVEHIDNAFKNWTNLELLAEELRYSHNKLSEITGNFSSDDLLGKIFSKFCIGK